MRKLAGFGTYKQPVNATGPAPSPAEDAQNFNTSLSALVPVIPTNKEAGKRLSAEPAAFAQICNLSEQRNDTFNFGVFTSVAIARLRRANLACLPSKEVEI